jgi:hypothetical protein
MGHCCLVSPLAGKQSGKSLDFWTGPEFAATSSGGYTKEVEDMLKVLSPSMVSFIKNLPAIEGIHPSHFRHVIDMGR